MQSPFLGQSEEGRSLNIDASRSINFYPEIIAQGSATAPKAQYSLIGAPGTVTFIDFISGDIRLLYNFNDRCFTVVGVNLYEIYLDGTYSNILGVFPDTYGRISVTDNGLASNGVGGDQMIMVVNNAGYVYNIVTMTFTAITAPGFPTTAKTVTYQDGYFIVTNGTMSFFVSALYDGLTWPGLAFASVTATPDSVQYIATLNQQLFFIKKWSTEVWYNAGSSAYLGSPFTRVPGAIMPFGTPAPLSVAYGLDTILFLANQGHARNSSFAGVALMQGNAISIVSTPAINYRITQLSNIHSATAYCYADEGHVFYMLTFPDDDITFCYDITTKQWHERSTTVEGFSKQHRHLSELYTFFGNRHLVSDYRSSKLMHMGSAYNDDDGLWIESTRISPPLFDHNIPDDFIINRFIIDAEGGVGRAYLVENDIGLSAAAWATYPGTEAGIPAWVLTLNGADLEVWNGYISDLDPKAWLSWSNDGGHTWSNEYGASMGKSGAYTTRMVWRRLGRSRDKVFKLRMADRVRKVLLGAYIND